MPNRLLDDWAVMMSLLESYNLNALQEHSVLAFHFVPIITTHEDDLRFSGSSRYGE